MTDARLTVRQAGPLSSIQDQGRFGWARFGVPRSGPVDRVAYLAAVRAVRGGDRCSVIELSGGGIELGCELGELGFALCGAEFTAVLDGDPLGAWTVASLRPGMSLVIRCYGGNWAYLAFAAQLEVQPWLGSTSTHALSGLGGGMLSAGAILNFAGAQCLEQRQLPRPDDSTPIGNVRAVLGPQDRFFGGGILAKLTNAEFRASAQVNRMGMVLEGPPLLPMRVDMPSEPATRGAIQVDGTGTATLLLADHQTTGGYPKIATLIGRDADRLAQLTAGSPFTVSSIAPDQAITDSRRAAQRQADYLASVACADSLASRLLRRNLITAFLDGA